MSSPTYSAASAAADSWGGSAGPHTMLYTIPALTNGYLIVGVGAWKGTPANLISVTWNTSQSLASLGTHILSGSGDSLELWGIKNPAAASNQALDFLWDADPAGAIMVAMCYENVDQTTPVVGGSYITNTGAGGTPATATLNVAAASDDMIIAFCWNDAAVPFTATGSQNERIDSNLSSLGDIAAYDLVASGASTTMAATYSNGDPWVEAGVALRGIGAGPGPAGLMWL